MKSIIDDGKTANPEGAVIYGKGSLKNMPTLDSLSGKGLTEQFKRSLLQSMQSSFSQVSFPVKHLKVGGHAISRVHTINFRTMNKHF